MVSSYAFFPTLLDYIGIDAPKDPKRVGRSYAGFLRGTENLNYIERTPEWPSELYDLESDPGERTNAVGDPKHGKEKKALQTRLHGFFQKVGAPPIEQWRSTTRQNLPVYE
jgi:arylsulfatase A-like enzyme